MRDAAGMVRSLDYAASAALAQAAAAAIGAEEILSDHARAWRDLSTSAFLSAYRSTIIGCVSYPDDPDDAAALLNLMILEKALYEIDYEAANRPDWIGIPVNGVIGILDDLAD